MRRRQALSALVLLSAIPSLIGFADDKSASNPPQAEKIPENVDEVRFAKAPVVLRAKLEKPLGGETGIYGYRMKVISTIKNTVRQKFGPEQDVYTVQALGKGIPLDPGPPAEECTIYIEPRVRADVTTWIFLSGSSSEGVSHVAK